MKKIIWILAALALVLPSPADAKKKTHVVVPKAYPVYPAQPTAVPVYIIPPLAILYDLQRRTTCQGDVLGMGGPGFDGKTIPTNSTVMIPAYQRSVCAATPK